MTISERLNLKRFFIGDGPQSFPIKLHHRRVYILPTRQGVVLSIMLFIMLIGSINYANSLGYFVTFLLTSTVIVSIFHTYKNILNLTVTAVSNPPLFANKESYFSIQINNDFPQSRVSLSAFTKDNEPTLFDLKPGLSKKININYCFTRRGLQPFPRVIIESRFPLGLFHTWSHIELDHSFIIFPSPSKESELPQSQDGMQEGLNNTSIGVDEFSGLREYQKGDSLHRVHWKNAAKHSTLQSKLFSGSATNQLWIDWNNTTVTNIEKKISQLTGWVLLANSQGVSYGLRLPGQEIPISFGAKHRDLCLTTLALFKATV